MTNCSANKSEKGLVQVYTGHGKGKTTAALGQAMRAAGQGLKVVMIQFVKGDANSGELFLIRKYPFMEIVQPNKGDCFTQPREELKAVVDEAMEMAQKYLAEGNYDMVILDEIFVAVSMGLLSASDVVSLMEQKASRTELILTGRNAPTEIVRMADLVTEMLMIKHPFAEGTPARKGIEY